MRLKKWDRVRYNPNPLVEVVAQIRFPRIFEIDEQLPSEFQKELRLAYPFVEVQEDAISVMIGQGDSSILANNLPKRRIFHFISCDRSWRISLNGEYIALTCDAYEQWEGFFPRIMEALSIAKEVYPISLVTRIGLRYRDLIIREIIGLGGVSWRELIEPFLLGTVLPDGLDESGQASESDVIAAQSYMGLILDDCQLSLRHGLFHKEVPGESAYMIDADFFIDNKTMRLDLDDIKLHLDKFHANAGSVFRSCIRSRLHEALNPTPLG